jgi:ABC-2 type transport system ATP-binding protein
MTIQTAVSAPAAASTGGTLAIEARDLVKTYPKGVQALDGLSFAVPAGTVFALLGPNGAGKSTTVKILTTLAQADSGTAMVAGLDVRARPARVRHLIGVVAQLSGADPVATGRENVMLSGRIQGLRGRELARRADELLGRFGLADAAGRRARTYSGGMRRRLDVAMGLVNRPQVLFLDEPTAGLDPESRSAMWTEIGRLAAAEGLSVLLTTHYLEEADQLASRLAIVDRGRVVVAGTPDELKGELHGDAVHLELASDTAGDHALAALAQVPGVREPRVERTSLSARADEGATALPGVIAALRGAGVTVLAATVARPSLDDVYLRYSGRRFTDADQSPATPATQGGSK